MKDGIAQGVYILSSDITTVKNQERLLQQLARADALTGLPNRRSYDEKLQEIVTRSSRYGHGFAVMFLDVDNFKRINDTQSHGAGDEVLKEIALRLLASVRETDFVSRPAGDEFTIILDEVTEQEDAANGAQKILDTIRKPFMVAGVSSAVSISIGITSTAASAIDVAQITKAADDALYQAKAAGRNGYLSVAVRWLETCESGAGTCQMIFRTDTSACRVGIAAGTIIQRPSLSLPIRKIPAWLDRLASAIGSES